jgi:RNA polymerase sigma-70 factor (ECF subfamily)
MTDPIDSHAGLRRAADRANGRANGRALPPPVTPAAPVGEDVVSDEVAPTLTSVRTDVDGLFRDHYARLVQSLTLVAGDRDTAADAVQEAFVTAHLKWRTIQHYDDPVGWIRRVAINKLRDGHRSSGRRRRLLERLHRTDTTSTDADATHRDFERQSGSDGLSAVLDTLPRQQRLCVALFYVDGLTVAEIAEALGISDGAVKFHLHQGRERLRARHPRTGQDGTS